MVKAGAGQGRYDTAGGMIAGMVLAVLMLITALLRRR
jgi:tetrahydromethanopterin S-methyltransferase subunit F